jgi:iron(III) transport system ATP-binding protein
MLRVVDLRKTFPIGSESARALRGVDVEVAVGEFFTLLGPSACGKSTLLRCVAGLERPDEGEIWINDQVVFSSRSMAWVPGHRRDIGMVFQSYAIWPHMSVFENVAFPLVRGRAKKKAGEVRELVESALRMVQLEHLGSRSATLLSGGQQQRVALARALVREPKLLLLDEPLSNLDARLRDEMRKKMRSLQRTLGITTLYVTHDQVEALTLSDRVAVMQDGLVVQVGTPRELYQSPRHPFAAKFVGNANLVAGVVRRVEGTLASVETAVGEMAATGTGPLSPGQQATLAIRPEAIDLSPGRPGDRQNVLPVTVDEMMFVGEGMEGRVVVNDSVAFDVRLHTVKELRRGESVFAHFRPEDCRVIPQ